MILISNNQAPNPKKFPNPNSKIKKSLLSLRIKIFLNFFRVFRAFVVNVSVFFVKISEIVRRQSSTHRKGTLEDGALDDGVLWLGFTWLNFSFKNL